MANLVEIKEQKDLARKTPIEIFPDPKIAVVLTNQQSGATNTPLVSVGDSVVIGQKIADSKERISAPVHSPISGKVIKIANVYNSCFEMATEAVYIEGDGKKTKDKTLTPISEDELKDTSNEVLLKRIREAGGRIIAPPKQQEEVDLRLATAADTEGNTFSVVQTG